MTYSTKFMWLILIVLKIWKYTNPPVSVYSRILNTSLIVLSAREYTGGKPVPLHLYDAKIFEAKISPSPLRFIKSHRRNSINQSYAANLPHTNPPARLSIPYVTHNPIYPNCGTACSRMRPSPSPAFCSQRFSVLRENGRK